LSRFIVLVLGIGERTEGLGIGEGSGV